MASYCLDVELFISEVKKYPELWDVNSEEYRYKKRKQEAWGEIAKLFMSDFDELPNKEKLDVYRKLHGKWRNIRDSFVRHIKRKYGKKGYVYARHLDFLNALYKDKQNSQSGSDVEGDNDNDDHISDDDDGKLKRLGFKCKKFELITDPNNTWDSDAEDSPSTLENLKRKRISKPLNEIEYVDTPFPDATSTASYTTSTEDEDKSFFESLLPAVREFNLDQKLEFRTEVLCLIKAIRSKHGRRQYIKLDPVTGNFD